jgi:serine protease AprX
MKTAVSVFLALALVCSGAQKPRRAKISPDATATDSLAQVRVLVQWNTAIGDQTSALISSVGGKVVSEFKSVRQGVYLMSGSAAQTLSQDPSVKFISPDRKVKKKLATTAATINAAQSWANGYTGNGVGVAVLDSGMNVDDNLGATPNKTIVFTNDFTDEAYSSKGKKSNSFGLDWYGHGQHIAGIIASSGKASSCGDCFKSMIGIAPGAKLINLKVLDANGEGSDSQVIAAIDQAITLKDTYNIRVMNMSLGRPVVDSYVDDPLCQAVEAAWKAGITIVVAAGNEGRDNSANNQGYGTILAPGNDPYVITVGSMKTMLTNERDDDLIASYSSKGPSAVDHIVKPDIVAPGNLIVSLLAQHGRLPLTNPLNAVTSASIQGGNTPANPPVGQNVPDDIKKQPPTVNFGPGYSQNYYTLSGTSMAAAVVSGAVADLIQAHPNLTPDQVKILLMQTATKNFPTSSSVTDDEGNVYTSYYDIFTVGAGYLDLQAAMNGAGSVPASGNALSPVSNYDPSSDQVSLTFDSQSVWTNPSVWSNKSMWGAGAVWSSSVLAGSNAVWSSKSMWGASSDSASKSLWGAKSMWGASSDASSGTLDSASSVELSGEN